MRTQGLFGLLALSLALPLVGLTGCGGGGDVTQSQSQAFARSKEPQTAEASIEGFGDEARGAEREAILAVYEGYQEAIANKDYPSACSYMAAVVHEGLEQLTGKKGVDCAMALPLIVSPEAAQVAKGQLQGTVAKVRAKGDRGFVVFKAPGAKLYDMAMIEEGGEWKVASAVAGVLAPEL